MQMQPAGRDLSVASPCSQLLIYSTSAGSPALSPTAAWPPPVWGRGLQGPRAECSSLAWKAPGHMPRSMGACSTGGRRPEFQSGLCRCGAVCPGISCVAGSPRDLDVREKVAACGTTDLLPCREVSKEAPFLPSLCDRKRPARRGYRVCGGPGLGAQRIGAQGC